MDKCRCHFYWLIHASVQDTLITLIILLGLVVTYCWELLKKHTILYIVYTPCNCTGIDNCMRQDLKLNLVNHEILFKKPVQGFTSNEF